MENPQNNKLLILPAQHSTAMRLVQLMPDSIVSYSETSAGELILLRLNKKAFRLRDYYVFEQDIYIELQKKASKVFIETITICGYMEYWRANINELPKLIESLFKDYQYMYYEDWLNFNIKLRKGAFGELFNNFSFPKICNLFSIFMENRDIEYNKQAICALNKADSYNETYLALFGFENNISGKNGK